MEKNILNAISDNTFPECTVTNVRDLQNEHGKKM